MTTLPEGFRTLVASATLGLASLSPAICTGSLRAQAWFADGVASASNNGGAGGGIFQPLNALGAPGGSADCHSLGINGDLTLSFTLPICDGPGCDLIVSENPFRSFTDPNESFAEVCYVEVSSNGIDFARFPSRYFGPAVQPGPFGFVAVGAYSGLAGQHPVLATDPARDARDVVEAGGDAFDLQDLATDPLVQMGLLDLGAVSHVRMVDVDSGNSLDAAGTPIFDAGSGSADIDAVTAIHQQGQVPTGNPTVELTVQQDGTMTLRLEDPDGWQDLDPSSVRAAIWGLPVDAAALLSVFTLQSLDTTGFTLVQNVPLPASLLFTLSVSLKDMAGNRSGMIRTRPGV